MSRRHPPLLLRLAVVIGAVTLLLGVAGVILLVLEGDESPSAAGPGLAERVRVVGAPEDASLTVSVRWEEGAIAHQETARSFGDVAGVFLLPPALAGKRIVIEVSDSETSRPLASREILLRAGEEVRLVLEQAADR